MLKSKLFTVMLMFLLLVTFSVYAADKKTDMKPEMKKELKNQTNCPVMGGKIDSTTYTDIQGQRVYHCCPGCSQSLKNDPDKFFKKAAVDGVLFENIQTTCPVSGKELTEKTVFTDYEGRRIYFCCEDCISTFNKEPQKILKQIDSKKDKTENKKEMSEDHSNHNH